MSPTMALIWARAMRTGCGLSRCRRLGIATRRAEAGTLGAGRGIGRVGERDDRALEVPGDVLDAGQRVIVGEQPEAQATVVAEDRDAQRLAASERHDRVQPDEATAEQVQGKLRA